jgi:hypothetical protein
VGSTLGAASFLSNEYAVMEDDHAECKDILCQDAIRSATDLVTFCELLRACGEEGGRARESVL